MKLGRNILRGANFTLRRRIAGRPIFLPVLGGRKAGLSGEKFLLEVLGHFLPQLEGAFIDVGANMGQTLCKVKALDPRRRYYGFEPNPACHAYLHELVRVNGWPDVSILPCGLSDRTEMLRIHLPPREPTAGAASFLPAMLPDGRREVELSETQFAGVFAYTELAHLVEGPLAFVKIDVEGAELEVLRGMRAAIERDEPVVTVELIPDPSLVGRHEQTVSLLQSLEYDVYTIDKTAANGWSGLSAMAGYTLPADRALSDYLAVPRSRSLRLANAASRCE